MKNYIVKVEVVGLHFTSHWSDRDVKYKYCEVFRQLKCNDSFRNEN